MLANSTGLANYSTVLAHNTVLANSTGLAFSTMLVISTVSNVLATLEQCNLLADGTVLAISNEQRGKSKKSPLFNLSAS